MSIPVKNPVPEVNTSANIALSQWNDSVEKKELLSLDSFIDSIILNGAGSDFNISSIGGDLQNRMVYKLGDTSDILLKVRIGSNTPDDIPELGIGSNYDITGETGTGLVWDLEEGDITEPYIMGIIFTITLTEDTSENYTASDGADIPKTKYIRNITSETYCNKGSVIFYNGFDNIDINDTEYKRVVTNEQSDAAYLNVYINGLDKSNTVGNTVKIFLPLVIAVNTSEEGLFFTTKYLTGNINSQNRKYWQVPYARKSTVGSLINQDTVNGVDINTDNIIVNGETYLNNTKNVDLVNGVLYSYKEMDFQDDWVANQSGEIISNYILPFDDNFTEYNITTQTVTKYPKFRLEIIDSFGNKKVYYSNETTGSFFDYEKDIHVAYLSYDGNYYKVELTSSIIEESGWQILQWNPFFEGDVVCNLYAPMARLDDQEFRVKKITSKEKQPVSSSVLDKSTEIKGGELNLVISITNSGGFAGKTSAKINSTDGFVICLDDGVDPLYTRYTYDYARFHTGTEYNKDYLKINNDTENQSVWIDHNKIEWTDSNSTTWTTNIELRDEGSNKRGLGFDKNIEVNNNVSLQSLMFGKLLSNSEGGVRIGVFWATDFPQASDTRSIFCYSGPGDTANTEGTTLSNLKIYLTGLFNSNNRTIVFMKSNASGTYVGVDIVTSSAQLNALDDTYFEAGIIFQVVS